MGPYFVEDKAQNPLTVNQERYRENIIAPFVRDLKSFCRARNLPLRRQWMQQDGDTAHTAGGGELLPCLLQADDDRLISHGTEFHLLHYNSEEFGGHPAYVFNNIIIAIIIIAMNWDKRDNCYEFVHKLLKLIMTRDHRISH